MGRWGKLFGGSGSGLPDRGAGFIDEVFGHLYGRVERRRTVAVAHVANAARKYADDFPGSTNDERTSRVTGTGLAGLGCDHEPGGFRIDLDQTHTGAFAPFEGAAGIGPTEAHGAELAGAGFTRKGVDFGLGWNPATR